jgi:hypothetical protein
MGLTVSSEESSSVDRRAHHTVGVLSVTGVSESPEPRITQPAAVHGTACVEHTPISEQTKPKQKKASKSEVVVAGKNKRHVGTQTRVRVIVAGTQTVAPAVIRPDAMPLFQRAESGPKVIERMTQLSTNEVKRFLSTAGLSAKTAKLYASSELRILADCRIASLHELTERKFIDFLINVMSTGVQSVKRFVVVVSHFQSPWAISEQWVNSSGFRNAIRGLHRSSTTISKRRGSITKTRLIQLLSLLPEKSVYKLGFITMYSAGLRHGELVRLRASQIEIDGEDALIHIASP